jgi:hypothetical protein
MAEEPDPWAPEIAKELADYVSAGVVKGLEVCLAEAADKSNYEFAKPAVSEYYRGVMAKAGIKSSDANKTIEILRTAKALGGMRRYVDMQLRGGQRPASTRNPVVSVGGRPRY